MNSESFLDLIKLALAIGILVTKGSAIRRCKNDQRKLQTDIFAFSGDVFFTVLFALQAAECAQQQREGMFYFMLAASAAGMVFLITAFRRILSLGRSSASS